MKEKAITALAGGSLLVLVWGTMLALAVMTVPAVTFVMASNPEISAILAAVATPLFFGVGLAIALLTKSVATAWRRIFLLSALLCFALTSSFLISSGVVAVASEHELLKMFASHMDDRNGAFAAISGSVGFVLGIVFLTVGLLVGRKAVAVQQAA